MIGEVRANYDIIGFEMFYDPVFFQGYHPARVLVHPVVDDENGVPAPQRGIYQYCRVHLQNHGLAFIG